MKILRKACARIQLMLKTNETVCPVLCLSVCLFVCLLLGFFEVFRALSIVLFLILTA